MSNSLRGSLAAHSSVERTESELGRPSTMASVYGVLDGAINRWLW